MGTVGVWVGVQFFGIVRNPNPSAGSRGFQGFVRGVDTACNATSQTRYSTFLTTFYIYLHDNPHKNPQTRHPPQYPLPVPDTRIPYWKPPPVPVTRRGGTGHKRVWVGVRTQTPLRHPCYSLIVCHNDRYHHSLMIDHSMIQYCSLFPGNVPK